MTNGISSFRGRGETGTGAAGEVLVGVLVEAVGLVETLRSGRDERNIVVAAAPAAADTPATIANVVFDMIEASIRFIGNTLLIQREHDRKAVR